MVGGLVASVIVFAAGAILRFALTTNPYQHGFNLHTVGVILMFVGAVGALLSIIGGVLASARFRRRRSVIDDNGRVVTREDRYS